MYSSWAFCAFRDVLHSIDFDVKDFAREELEEGRPLLDDGWQMETLTALLEFEFEPNTSPCHKEKYCSRCRSCKSCKSWLSVVVQPYWQVILESIKKGIHPQRISSDAQYEQPSMSQRNLTILNDSSTDTADDSALFQDPALSEDQAAHPDQESPTIGVDISSAIFDRTEVWCIKCWLHFKKTGHPRSPVSETESSDEDDTSEDDFSPYLIHT